ncbi:hypothetical protein ZEAMMB73_Zm00001d008771 [Zea mays]|uniref:GDSL esterase/lipase n=1 Tax=Zea mays TaxID=4577 RepID=A0A1D6FFD6_MAIZE|nr:hypothetical protein ZEAMMB73_Zm00001d008771 [Zea mays]
MTTSTAAAIGPATALRPPSTATTGQGPPPSPESTFSRRAVVEACPAMTGWMTMGWRTRTRTLRLSLVMILLKIVVVVMDGGNGRGIVVEKTKTMIKSLYILSKVPLDSCKSACTCSSNWTGSCNARSMGCRLIVYHYCLSVLVPTNIQHIVAFSGNASQGGTTLPMIYVLGDSLAPVENNNNLVTLLKANFLRNNIDYLGHKAIGCFSNGKNSIDFLAKSLDYDKLYKGLEVLADLDKHANSTVIIPLTGSPL